MKLLLPLSTLCGFHVLAARCQTPPYRDELLSFHQSLVEIPSVTGQEAEVGKFLIEYFEERGFITERQFLPPLANGTVSTRFNIIVGPGSL